MRKKVLFISLALALLLTTFMPAAALAAKPPPKVEDFNATGAITYITPGDVKPAGNSGRFVVVERELGGALSGAINGAYTLTYKANVELATQAGTLHGTLEAGSYVLQVNGTIEPLQPYSGTLYPFIGWFEVPGFGVVPIYYVPGFGLYPIFELEINGQWTIVDGAQGNGDFKAYAAFIPTPEGHVAYIVDSAFGMTGKWQP